MQILLRYVLFKSIVFNMFRSLKSNEHFEQTNDEQTQEGLYIKNSDINQTQLFYFNMQSFSETDLFLPLSVRSQRRN